MFKCRKLHCSFCGKSETEVAKLVAGPRVYICDSCVTIASRIISDSNGGDQPVRVESTIWCKLADRIRRLFHVNAVNPVSESG
jgi:ATP-dependent protease Clp ATPase subunit